MLFKKANTGENHLTFDPCSEQCGYIQLSKYKYQFIYIQQYDIFTISSIHCDVK